MELNKLTINNLQGYTTIKKIEGNESYTYYTTL